MPSSLWGSFKSCSLYGRALLTVNLYANVILGQRRDKHLIWLILNKDFHSVLLSITIEKLNKHDLPRSMGLKVSDKKEKKKKKERKGKEKKKKENTSGGENFYFSVICVSSKHQITFLCCACFRFGKQLGIPLLVSGGSSAQDSIFLLWPCPTLQPGWLHLAQHCSTWNFHQRRLLLGWGASLLHDSVGRSQESYPAWQYRDWD